MESLFWGAVLRFLQALAQAAPTILVGLIVAGLFRRLLGHAGTRRLFGDGTWRSLPQAWAIGMLLPVCSLGVIPVLRQMRKAGVSGGTILAFGLTAPLFNPISVLYGLTLAKPLVIFTFSLCALLIVTVVGVAWDRLFPHTAAAEPEPPQVAPGAKRMLAVAITGVRELAGPSSLYIALGLLGVALLSLALPPGSLQTAAEPDDIWAPLFMALAAIPAYATPMTAMVQLASMFQHGNSVGAAFALLVLGAGTNLGLAAWMIRNYSLRRTAVWFAILLAIVVALAYAVDRPFYPQGVEPAGHTHTFDIYCSPFHYGAHNPLGLAITAIKEKTAPYEIVSLLALAALAAAGCGLARLDSQTIETWLQQGPRQKQRFDIVLPAPVLGGAALLALVAFSVLGCYLYYPAPREVLEEMKLVNVEVVTSARAGDWDTAQYWIPIYDDWTRKLQVSMFLRGEELTDFRRAKASVLRDKLELLEHGVKNQEAAESRDLGMAVDRSFRRLRAAYRPQPIN